MRVFTWGHSVCHGVTATVGLKQSEGTPAHDSHPVYYVFLCVLLVKAGQEQLAPLVATPTVYSLFGSHAVGISSCFFITLVGDCCETFWDRELL